MSPELRLGTRGSPLALWQARAVAARIAEERGQPCRIVIIKTSGDRLQDAPLSEIGGKRLFVKEIEEALLGHEIDLAVHSSKDLPATLPRGLVIAGVLPREDPRDAVVLSHAARLKADPTSEKSDTGVGPGFGVGSGFSRTVSDIEQLAALLGQSPSIGTGSVRRIAQLIRLLPGAMFAAIRGNLDTRLRKLDAGDYDALVLAAAGLHRLGFQSRISLALPPTACVPAPGQGIVAIETREDDPSTRDIVRAIDDQAAATALVAERAVVEALGGGCQMPLGAFASAVANEIELVAVVVSRDGSRAVCANERGPSREAAAIGARVGARLIADGAEEILATSGPMTND